VDDIEKDCGLYTVGVDVAVPLAESIPWEEDATPGRKEEGGGWKGRLERGREMPFDLLPALPASRPSGIAGSTWHTLADLS